MSIVNLIDEDGNKILDVLPLRVVGKVEDVRPLVGHAPHLGHLVHGEQPDVPPGQGPAAGVVVDDDVAAESFARGEHRVALADAVVDDRPLRADDGHGLALVPREPRLGITEGTREIGIFVDQGLLTSYTVQPPCW